MFEIYETSVETVSLFRIVLVPGLGSAPSIRVSETRGFLISLTRNDLIDMPYYAACFFCQ